MKEAGDSAKILCVDVLGGKEKKRKKSFVCKQGDDERARGGEE